MSALVGVIILVAGLGVLLGVGLERIGLVIFFFTSLMVYLHFFGGI
jgi:hypothetical protein